MNPHKRYSYELIIALVAGALLPLAFAPHSLWYLAPLLLSPVCFLIQQSKKPVHCFWYAFLYTFAAFLVGASWIFISIHTYGQASSLVAGFITLLFVSFLALQAGLLVWGWRSIFTKKNYWNQCWLLPSVWVIIEWCREWVFTGFPWLQVGDIATTPYLSGWVPLLGVYGTSYLLICICAHITHSISTRKMSPIVMTCTLIALTLGLGYSAHDRNWTAPLQDEPLKVALIQGNIPVSMKWDPKNSELAVDHYLAATRQHLDADIIIWPETAIPIFDTSVPKFLNAIDALMDEKNAALISGIAHYDKNTHAAYNSMLVFGKGEGLYNKEHLVPFGEYFPMPMLLGWVYRAVGLPMSNFTPGASNQELLEALDTSVAPAICYEVAYPSLIRERTKNANWLLVISDDAWFDKSAASAQQLQKAQMRALENGLPVLYASNSGITAIIDSNGRITKRLPTNTYATLEGNLVPRAGETPLQRFPLNTWPWLSVIVLAISWVARSKEN